MSRQVHKHSTIASVVVGPFLTGRLCLQGIPQDAFCFCMNHGLVPPDGERRRSSDEVGAASGVDVGTDAAAAFLITGGFVYFDSEGQVVGTKAIIVTKRGGKSVVSKNERHVLQYGDPQSLTAETVANLGRRWQQNTLSFVLDRGSTDYAWCATTTEGLLGVY